MEWSFVHKTSSPHYPKGNVHAEQAVGVIKEVYTQVQKLLPIRITCALYYTSIVFVALNQTFMSNKTFISWMLIDPDK